MKLIVFIYTFSVLMICSCFSVFAGDNIVIDKSQISNGLVCVQYKEQLKKNIKVQVEKADTKYTYTIKNNNITNLPLQMGSGNYKVTVLENVSDTKYRVVLSDSFDVSKLDDKKVYINSIQLIDFNRSMKAISDLEKLTSNAKTDKEKLDIVYDYITANFSYDFDKLNNLQNDYIPVIDDVYKYKKGICYDFSSLFASALRDIGIPTRLQMGYFTEVKEYHAWNQVLIDGKWITIDTTYDAQARSYKLKYSQAKDSSQFTVIKQY